MSPLKFFDIKQGQGSNQDSDGDGLPDEYESGHGRYSVVDMDSPIVWDTANTLSTGQVDQYGIPGHLVTIIQDWEMQIVSDILRQSANGSAKACWIGLRKSAADTDFKWVTGEGMWYMAWNPSMPTGNGQEQYAVVSQMEYRGC